MFDKRASIVTSYIGIITDIEGWLYSYCSLTSIHDNSITCF